MKIKLANFAAKLLTTQQKTHCLQDSRHVHGQEDTLNVVSFSSSAEVSVHEKPCPTTRTHWATRTHADGKQKATLYMCITYRSVLSAILVLVDQHMVRASHRRSEGCEFDSRLELRKIFLSLRLSLSSKQFTFKAIQY